MAKRGATSDINHYNWDEPYEPEEAGAFKPAPEDTLNKRVIKTAKRRIKTNETDAGTAAFASFTGFKSSGAPLNIGGPKKTFSFLNNVTSTSSTPTTNGVTSSTVSKSLVTPQDTYLANLMQLNREVSDWIKTQVDSEPVCILTPIFKDYENHLKELQEKRDSAEKSNTASNKFTIPMPADSIKTTNPDLLNSTKSNPFSSLKETGKSPLLQNEEKSAASSIFGSIKPSSTAASLMAKPDPASLMVNPFLTKTDNKPFSFSNGSAPTSSSNNKQDDNEEGEGEPSDEPVKVEIKPVQEEGSVFSTRCKVFVKKDENYNERGVGTLFINKVNEEKHQLLVRAETVLGNILLNVLLSSSLPTKRLGKNNVMLVCMPTPSDLPPPTTVLLRVKTEAEADTLLATINKYKS